MFAMRTYIQQVRTVLSRHSSTRVPAASHASAPVRAVERRLLLAESPEGPPAGGGPQGVQLRLGFRVPRGRSFGWGSLSAGSLLLTRIVGAAI